MLENVGVVNRYCEFEKNNLKNNYAQIGNSERLCISQCKVSLNVWILRCYSFSVIKGILLEIIKIRWSSNLKAVREKAQSFFIDLLKAYFSYSKFCYELSV